MKKKIINGILMVALLFAATTSFVSCKDNVDDELVPVYAQLSQQKTDLENRIASVESQLSGLQSQITQNATDIASLKKQYDALESEIATLKSQLATINDQIGTLSASVDELKNDLKAVEGRVDALEGDFAGFQAQIDALNDKINKIITGIEINHTVNEVYGTYDLPGINVKMLAPFYGENLTGIISFPNSVKGALVDQSANAIVLTKEEVDAAGGKALSIRDEGYITEATGNAGWMFFTVNSEDPASFDINEWTLSIENSTGYAAPVSFINAKPSSFQIQWGRYHSGIIDSDADLNGNPTFFQAQAQIAPKDLEAAKFDFQKFIDYKTLNQQYQDAVAEVKAAAGKKAKVTSIAKSAANIILNLFSGILSGDNKDFKNPTWSAQKLVLSKDVDGVTVKKYADAFDLCVTAVTPLSYNSFTYLEQNATAPDLSYVENLAYRLAQKIKAQLPTVSLGNVTITTITKTGVTFGAGGNTYVLLTNAAPTPNPGATPGVVYAGDIEEAIIDPLLTAINNGLSTVDLSNSIQGLDKINNLGSKVDGLEARFEDYMERFANSIVTSLNNGALTQAVTPYILYYATDGIKRLTYGQTVKAGVMQINMTSPTEELIVPSYAKYIAVFDEDGKAVQADVLPGKTQLTSLNLTKPGNYFVVLSSMDYWGYIVNKKYLVKVVE